MTVTANSNRGDSLQIFLVKCIGSELRYNRSPLFTTYGNDVITTHAHINERVAAAAVIKLEESFNELGFNTL